MALALDFAASRSPLRTPTFKSRTQTTQLHTLSALCNPRSAAMFRRAQKPPPAPGGDVAPAPRKGPSDAAVGTAGLIAVFACFYLLVAGSQVWLGRIQEAVRDVTEGREGSEGLWGLARAAFPALRLRLALCGLAVGVLLWLRMRARGGPPRRRTAP